VYRNNHNKKQKFRNSAGIKYSSKDYVNPYFRRKQKKKKKFNWPSFNISWKLKLIFYIVLLLFLILFTWVFAGSFFLVNNININGGGRLEEGELSDIALKQITEKRWLIFPQKHILFYSTIELAEKLRKKYAFDNLKISKKIPNTIKLEYQEKSYSLIWQEDNDYFYSDNSGLILDEANLLEIGEKDYPIIKNESGIRLLGAKIVASQSFINAVLDVFKQFKKFTDLKIERFIFDQDQKNIKFKIVNGPIVHMNLEDDLNLQINKLLILKNEKLKNDFSQKEYIILGHGNTLYYR
jgi:hypothetical protein